MNVSKKVSLMGRAAAVKETASIEEGVYNGVIVGVIIEDREVINAGKYDTVGDVIPEFRLVAQIDVNGEDKIVATWGIKSKFWANGSGSSRSKGFTTVGDVLDIKRLNKIRETIEENTDEDGNFDYGVFIGAPIEAEFIAKKAGDRPNLTGFIAGPEGYEISPMDLPEYLFTDETKDGVTFKSNMAAGFLPEFADTEVNAKLIESLESTWK